MNKLNNKHKTPTETNTPNVVWFATGLCTQCQISNVKFLVVGWRLLCLRAYALVLAWLFTSPAFASLQSDIDSIVRAQAPVRYSIQVVDGGTGKAVYEHHADEAMTPASNMKIVTSATALQYLGPEYEYVTRVGLVDGVLAVIGAGDPLLGDPDTDEALGQSPGWIFADIAERLLRLEVKRVAGIVVDSTIFDDERVHPSWPASELNKAYAAEVCGLNYNANRVDMVISNEEGRIQVSTEPETAFLDIANQVEAVNRGSGAVMALRKIGQPNHIVLQGKVRRAQGIELAVEKPAAYFGFLLAEELQRRGITVEGKLVEAAMPVDKPFHPVAEYRTPLKQVLQRCNKDSFNLAAESLLKTVAAHATVGGHNGSWTVGQRVVETYLAALGLDAKEYSVDDGSGLSHGNRLSAQALTRTLYSLSRSDYWDLYRESLAVAGTDGTIEKYDRFKQSPYCGNIRGKTGYINGVKAFSGLCLVGDRVYFFSILANHARGDTREAINRIACAVFDNG